MSGARSILRTAHLWLALLAALPLMAATLSGIILAFEPELAPLVYPDRMIADGATPAQSEVMAARFIDTVLAIEPDAQTIVAMTETRPERTQLGWYLPADGRGDADWRYLAAHPADGAIVATWTGEFWPLNETDVFETLHVLHTRLLAGEVGMWVLSVCAGILLTLAFSGLILWWPKSGRWRHALRMRPGRPFLRDLHLAVGALACGFIVFTATTGLVINFPIILDAALRPFTDVSARAGQPQHTASPPPNSDRLMLIRHAVDLMPSELKLRSATLDRSESPRLIVKFDDGPLRKGQATFDAGSGALLSASIPGGESARDVAQALVKPLHTGKLGGLGGRIAIGLIGAAIAVLLISGLWQWLRRPRAGVSRLRRGMSSTGASNAGPDRDSRASPQP